MRCRMCIDWRAVARNAEEITVAQTMPPMWGYVDGGSLQRWSGYPRAFISIWLPHHPLLPASVQARWCRKRNGCTTSEVRNGSLSDARRSACRRKQKRLYLEVLYRTEGSERGAWTASVPCRLRNRPCRRSARAKNSSERTRVDCDPHRRQYAIQFLIPNS